MIPLHTQFTKKNAMKCKNKKNGIALNTYECAKNIGFEDATEQFEN